MTTTIIFPNGQGGFVEGYDAFRLGYDCNGYELFYGGCRYKPLEVVECKPEEMLESSIDGKRLFRTETGRGYVAVH